jgi:hypothetical protein
MDIDPESQFPFLVGDVGNVLEASLVCGIVEDMDRMDVIATIILKASCAAGRSVSGLGWRKTATSTFISITIARAPPRPMLPISPTYCAQMTECHAAQQSRIVAGQP